MGHGVVLLEGKEKFMKQGQQKKRICTPNCYRIHGERGQDQNAKQTQCGSEKSVMRPCPLPAFPSRAIMGGTFSVKRHQRESRFDATSLQNTAVQHLESMEAV